MDFDMDCISPFKLSFFFFFFLTMWLYNIFETLGHNTLKVNNTRRKTFIFDWSLQLNFSHKQYVQLKSP
jgi:hypothetical protein